MADEHVIAVNGHRFKFGFRDIVQAVITLLACVGLYFTLVGRTNKNTDDINQEKEDRGKMWAEIGRMNDFGTRKSHEVDNGQQQTIDYHTKQLAEIQHDMREIGPKVDKIDANVLWLMGKQLEKR